MRLLLASICLLAATGCYYSAPVIPPMGMAFADVSAPIDIDAEATPVSAKVGEAEAMSILGLVALGDCSIDAAAKAGGLTTVEYLDYHYFNIIGVYQTFTTRAYGK